MDMQVYIKNYVGQQTVRELSLYQILKLRVLQWIYVPKNQRAKIKILL